MTADERPCELCEHQVLQTQLASSLSMAAVIRLVRPFLGSCVFEVSHRFSTKRLLMPVESCECVDDTRLRSDSEAEDVFFREQ